MWEGRLLAKATVVRRTRKVAYAKAEILDDSGSMVAKINSTCLMLSGDDAAGR